jgi:hypothetical protein
MSASSCELTQFDDTCTARPFMAGQGDIEEHIFFRPTGNTYGTAMRAFDPKTGEWADTNWIMEFRRVP